MGMGVNGQAPALRESSHSLGHTERAQAAAPTGIAITGTTITPVERFSSLPGVGSFSPDAITVSAAGTIYADQHPGVGSGLPAVVAFTAGSTPTILWHS